MPFVAWVTRADRYQDLVDRCDPVGGLPRSCFDQLCTAHGAQVRSSGAAWFHYPPDSANAGEPWFAATFRAPAQTPDLGHLQLSTSFTSPSFLRNAADMLELAVDIARPYAARVFEESGGRELDRESVDSILDPGGPYIRNLGQVWLDIRARLGRKSRAALEFPLGGVDEVSDFFVFSVQTESPMPELAELVAEPAPGFDAYVVAHGAVIADRDRDEAAVRITPIDATCVVVQPAIGTMPFRAVARATLDTLDHIHARSGGTVTYLGRPVDRALRDELEHYATGLGVELYEALVTNYAAL